MPSLLNLPAELRTQVYEYTLLFTDKCIIESSDEIEVFGGSVEDMHERLKQPAFTKVCRQVRAETLPICKLTVSKKLFHLMCSSLQMKVRGRGPCSETIRRQFQVSLWT